jgi:hypothetical protein
MTGKRSFNVTEYGMRSGIRYLATGIAAMRCPHCTTNFHEDWYDAYFVRTNGKPFIVSFRGMKVFWHYRTTVCSKCKDVVIQIAPINTSGSSQPMDWRMVYPVGASRGSTSPEVPAEIRNDYIEACNVLPISAKASAALSRRCLQNILHASGYDTGNLAKEIDLLLDEPDPRKAIPLRLRATIDVIRHCGNFGAHPINDKTALQIIEVEPHEAEWCLDILEECFEHFYVGPAAARARKASFDEKLAAAGKPPSK